MRSEKRSRLAVSSRMTAHGHLRRRWAALAVSVIAASTTCAGDEPAPREAFITNQSGQSLSIVDLATFKVTDEIKIGGRPAGIALSSDGKLAFVTAPEGNELVIVDAITRQIIKRVMMSGGPLGIATHPSTGMVYVADLYAH